MAVRELIRVGGRSARIQSAVHEAVQRLAATTSRDELTVPQIAAAAGVTPSTIYRRWGDLSALFADVAVQRLRPIADPEDTGTMTSDLLVFALSVSSALFLVADLSQPFAGLMQISKEQLRHTLAPLN